MNQRLPATGLSIPFFRPAIGDEEIAEVVATLRSGWLTSGPRVAQFEADFAAAVGARHALAVNSCTAALHLALEALGIGPGDGVLVPTMTFAATAEVVRYLGAAPILVDCEPDTLHVDLEDAERKIAACRRGELPGGAVKPRAIVPVHVGGLMLDLEQLAGFAERQRLHVVEDAAHSFPAFYRTAPGAAWRACGADSSDVTCFSFYANKTITTGEGGMAVCRDEAVAERMRRMALHGLSRDAWDRYRGGGSWDYRITAPGFKYNLTDLQAAIGLCQLRRAEVLRERREAHAFRYFELLSGQPEIALPPVHSNRIHSWHLFPIRLRLEQLRCDRNQVLEHLRARGIACSVHWRPLHLHPYYQQLGWRSEHLPVATDAFPRLLSLPLFPGLLEEEQGVIALALRELCDQHRR